MQKEFEKSGLHLPAFTYCLPDGSSYTCTYLPPDLNGESLFLAGEEIVLNGLKKVAQTRICIDSSEKVDELGRYLKGLGYDAHWGGNTFFEARLGPLGAMKALYPEVNWGGFSDKFRVDRIDPKRNRDRKILKSLMLQSFGRNPEKVKKIIEGFNVAVNDKSNAIYFVRNKESKNQVLGSFILKYLPALSEVELHSVAGISANPNVIQIERKLPIIMAGVFEAIENDYPQSQSFGIDNSGTVIYSGVDKLTFSASAVAEKYEKLGFKHSGRSGLVVYPDAKSPT